MLTQGALKGRLGTQRALKGHTKGTLRSLESGSKSNWALGHSKDAWALGHSKGMWALKHSGTWALQALEAPYLVESLSFNSINVQGGTLTL